MHACTEAGNLNRLAQCGMNAVIRHNRQAEGSRDGAAAFQLIEHREAVRVRKQIPAADGHGNPCAPGGN